MENNIKTDLNLVDQEVFKLINLEFDRQKNVVPLIASENFTSQAVMDACGSVLTNKYAEGYPHKRYYEGCSIVDGIEDLAIQRAKQIFNCNYVNVQPHSGSQANQAVFLALLEPGDTILGMSLDSGGHLTHGAKPNLSGKWFNPVGYAVNAQTNLIDYDQIEKLAIEHKPKLIIAGYSSYPRAIDFAEFRRIADKVGAFLLADIAHIAGLVATGHHLNPFPHAHIVTTTTHKTLRGPRGGMILTNDEVLAKKLDLSIFPGLQGGPLMNIIAGKAVAFKEALDPTFKEYIDKVIQNARALSAALIARGYDVITGGTDNHIVIVDLRKSGITGKVASNVLSACNIICNKNTVPFDPLSPFVTSGIRLGSPACTTRGFKEDDFAKLANLISDILDALRSNNANLEHVKLEVMKQVESLLQARLFY